MRLAAVVACAIAVATAPARAAAPEPSFALVYTAPDATGCPTEEALRAAVAGELAYDPWDPVDDGTSPRIVVTVRGVRAGVHGRIEMRAAGGRHLGARELEAPTCAELTPALVLALAVAVDPLRAALPPPQPKSPPIAAAATVTPPTTATPGPLVVAPSPARARFVDSVHLRVAFGVHTAVDLAPGPTLGFMGRVGFAARRWSSAVELRGDLLGAADADGGRVSATTMAAFLVPCVLHRIVAFCALAGAGGQEVAGSGFLASRSSWVPFAAVGGRVEVELAVSRVLAVAVRVDVLAPLTRTELFIGTERPQRVYRTAALSNTFGLALSTR